MSKILIVGGGVAGLSAGIFAQLNGHQAVICEKNLTVGGNLTGWQRGDYHIDNCIHWLTGTNPSTATYKTWEALGVLGDVEIYQGETLYTCEYQGETLSLYKDIHKLKSEMLRISPRDEKEIISFIKAIKLIQGLSGIGGENHDQKISPFRLMLSAPLLIRYHRMSTLDLSQKFTHPLLKRFITYFIGECFASLALIFVFAHFCGENAGIPKGSSVAMAQRMANRFKELDGTILISKEVDRVNLENGVAKSVQFKDGSVEACDYVVLATDPRVTFGKLINATMPRELERQYTDTRLLRFSSYHCAFSCDLADLPFKGDFVFEVPQKYWGKLQTKFLTIREFSHERDFAPEGKSIIQSLTFCCENSAKEFIKLKSNPEKYKSKKKELSSIIERLIVKKFPQLMGKLSCIDVWTPASYKKYVNSEIGSYMSFVFGPRVLPLEVTSRIKELDNVFLATQWQQIPGGLPISASEGKRAVEAICKLEKQRAKRRAKKPVPIGITN